MTLPYYYFFLSFVSYRVVRVGFCFVSFSHPLALSFALLRLGFFFEFLPITRHVVFQLDSLWLYVYVSRGDMARIVLSYFSFRPILDAPP